MIFSYIAAAAVASLSMIGILILGRRGHIVGTHRFVIPFAIGIFLGVIFFELIPETLESSGQYGSLMIVTGFLSFYLLSHLLSNYHHHCHGDDHHNHESKVYKILIGDGIHNIADGVVIASAFLINPSVGIATTIAIALHEIPQEIAEYGLLRSLGLSKMRALVYNLISASTIILGVFLAQLFIEVGNWLWVLTGFAAGNLLYIAASDLIPELQGDEHKKHFSSIFISTVVGLIFIVVIISFTHTLE